MTTDTRTAFARILAELADPTAEADSIRHAHSPFHLSDLADCYSPDGPDSPGAQFLARIARDVAEYVGSYASPADGVANIAEDYDSTAHEIADSAVPIYTHERWATFVDLGAYNEDATEIGDGDASDLTQLAGIALYMIADRLVRALAEELAEALDADADGEDTDDEGGTFTDLETGQRCYVTSNGGRFRLVWANGVEIGHGYDTFAEAEAAFLNRNA